MNIFTSILIYVLGLAVSAAVFRFVRQRLSESVANGLGVLVLLLAQYPLMLWITGGPHMAFTTWLIWCTLGALAATGFNFLLRPKS